MVASLNFSYDGERHTDKTRSPVPPQRPRPVERRFSKKEVVIEREGEQIQFLRGSKDKEINPVVSKREGEGMMPIAGVNLDEEHISLVRNDNKSPLPEAPPGDISIIQDMKQNEEDTIQESLEEELEHSLNETELEDSLQESGGEENSKGELKGHGTKDEFGAVKMENEKVVESPEESLIEEDNMESIPQTPPTEQKSAAEKGKAEEPPAKRPPIGPGLFNWGSASSGKKQQKEMSTLEVSQKLIDKLSTYEKSINDFRGNVDLGKVLLDEVIFKVDSYIQIMDIVKSNEDRKAKGPQAQVSSERVNKDNIDDFLELLQTPAIQNILRQLLISISVKS